MRKLKLLVLIVSLLSTALHAQFQKVQKTPVTAKKQTPVMVNGGFATLTPSGSNVPATTINLGGGKSMRVEMIRDAQNLPMDDQYRTSVSSKTPAPESNVSWNCTNSTMSFSAESKSFMSASQNQSSFPVGAIYRFEDFFSGNMNEISAGRRPFTMYTENIRTTGPVSQLVNDPRASSITAALRNIIQPFSNEVGSAGLIYRSFTSENEADFKLKVSAGGSYAAFQASASYDLSTYQKHVYLTFDVIKPMFKVVAERPSDGFFIDPAVASANPNYIYIKEVQYGTRLLVNLDIMITDRSDIAKISASYGIGDTTKKSFSANMDVISKLKTATTTVNAYVVGVPQSVTLFNNTTALNKDRLQDEISALVAKCNYGTAVPVIYKVADMNGMTVGVKSTTDEFVIRDCSPAASIYVLDDIKVSITTGNDNKETPSTFGVGLIKNAVPSLGTQDVQIAFSSNSDHIGESAVQQEDNFKLNKATFPANYPNPFHLSTFGEGGRINIHYYPNFPLDAWQVNSLVLTLTFVDQNNTPMIKYLRYQNIDKLLNNNLRTLECSFSRSFSETGVLVKQ
jgi:hypothetical protein